MKIVLSLFVYLVGCGASEPSVSGQPSLTPQSENTPEYYVSVAEYCKETGTAICDRLESCGQTTEKFTHAQCFDAYMFGCCEPKNDGVNLCTNETMTGKSSDEMNACVSGLSTMTCPDIMSWFSTPDTVPSFCQ